LAFTGGLVTFLFPSTVLEALLQLSEMKQEELLTNYWTCVWGELKLGLAVFWHKRNLKMTPPKELLLVIWHFFYSQTLMGFLLSGS
jgi:hypothetical protein